MAWIESHQSLGTHHKTKALKRLLKIKTPQAIGHLHLLWWWCVDNAPSGNLSGIDPQDLAEAAEWTGDSVRFVEALTDAGFIDRDTCTLHDWWDYAGKLIDQRTLTKEQRQAGGRQRQAKLTPEERSELGKKAITQRWAEYKIPAEIPAHLVSHLVEIPATVPNSIQPNRIPPCSPPLKTAATGKTNKSSPTETGLDNIGEVKDSPVAGADPAKLREPGHDNRSDSCADDSQQDPNLTAIALCYGQNIGQITEIVAEELKVLSSDYSAEWFCDAAKEAMMNNARKLSYVKSILERWKVEGFHAPRKNGQGGPKGRRRPGETPTAQELDEQERRLGIRK